MTIGILFAATVLGVGGYRLGVWEMMAVAALAVFAAIAINI